MNIREGYYEALLEASPTAIITVDLDHAITSWNPAAEQLFEYTRDEAVGRDLDELVAARPDLIEEARQRSAIAVSGREPGRIVTKRTRKDGSLVDVDIVSAPITIAGELVGYFAIYSDISELQRQRRYYESLFEASPTAIVTAQLDGTVTSWNPAAEQLFGYARGEAIGEHLDELVARREDLMAEARQRSALDAVGKMPGHAVTQRTRKDGMPVDVAIDSAPIVVAGEQVGYFALFSDVGPLQQRTRELAEKSRQLELASAHKSQFLANMSHELRTPLNAIIGFSEVLHEQMFGELNERQLAYVDDVLEAGRHLLSLINDVLDLAKIEAGKMELELAQVSVTEVLRSSLSMHADRASRGGVELELTTEPDEITIAADERRLRQIVFNLVSNAVKFTPPDGRVSVSARLHDGRVEIAVVDTGAGIPVQDLETIFEEFEQSTDGKQAEGTGLGLPLSRKLVELHHGRLWVESEPGQGSTFRFTLPVQQEVS